jgi:hypothetical protein
LFTGGLHLQQRAQIVSEPVQTVIQHTAHLDDSISGLLIEPA